MQVDDSKLHQGFHKATHSDLPIGNAGGCKSESKVKAGDRVTIEEIEDEHWQEERNRPKAESLTLHHIDDIVTQISAVQSERPSPSKHPTRKTTVEEIEDEHEEAYRIKPKSQKHLLIGIDEVDDVPDAFEELSHDQNSKAGKVDCKHALHSEIQSDDKEIPDTHIPESTLPPPSAEKPIRLRKKRFTPAGTSALGVSVLSTKGWVGSQDNGIVDLRLDSCADVTLISEDFFRSLKSAPKVTQGMRMQLWQLTDKDSSLKGFVRIPITMQSEEGILLETEAEAYIVPGMTVPILLGEDYQLNYELGVTRNVEAGSHIHFAGTDFRVPAHRVERTTDFDRMRQSALSVSHFVRAKLHRKAKAKRRQQKKKFGIEEKTVRAAEDVRLKPHECKRIRIDGQFDEDKEWLVQKNLLANANDSHFAVPNTLISARNPWIPIANPTDQPRYIRKGEVIGILEDPGEFFETPVSAERKEVLARHASAIADIIKTQLTEDTATTSQDVPTHGDPNEQEDYGPKTAAMPDSTVYPSSEMKELIDVGSLPEHLQTEAWEMLHRHQKAFGFDGRLGHLPTRVHIRTVDGQVPIAVPMYGSSPEKRRVMDEQIDKWFEQGVIEPSISPWSAPVVIAYRNGKPQFCVDYRKLNAATIPDEFPILRQS